MNDLAYVTATSALRAETDTCPTCRPPVLCARHVVAFTATRRTREATLLRNPIRPDPASPTRDCRA